MKRRQPINIRAEIANYGAYIPRLPESDQKIYDFAINGQRTQKEIASILKMTQGAVSHKLNKILRRVRFLEMLDIYDLSNLEEDLKEVLDPLEIEIIRNLADTTCQEETARRMNTLFALSGRKSMTQVKIRHRFHKAWLKLVKEQGEKFKRYTALMGFLQDNLYMLYEIKHPQDERGQYGYRKNKKVSKIYPDSRITPERSLSEIPINKAAAPGS